MGSETHHQNFQTKTGESTSGKSSATVESNADETPEAFNLAQIQILERIAVGANLSEILESIVRLVEKYTHGIGSILLFDPSTQRITHGAAPSLPDAYLQAIDGVKAGPDVGSCGTAAYLGERVIVEDLAHHPLWDRFKHVALPHGLRACWSSPIFSSDHTVLGTFAVYYKQPQKPTADELKAVDSATHLTSIALMKDRNERDLQRSEAKYRQFMETTHEGVLRLDLEGRFTYANERSLQMLGYTPEELLGQSALMIVADSEKTKAQAMLSRRRLGIKEQNEIQFKTRDGQTCWVILSSSPTFDENGNIEGMLGIVTDITERKTVELALQKREAQLRTMFDGATVPMLIVNPEYFPVKCNPASEKLLGIPEGSICGKCLLDHIHPHDRAEILQKKKELASSQAQSFSAEIRFCAANQNYPWVRMTVSQILSQNGLTENSIVMIEDISESKRFAKEIKAAERLRSLTFDTVGDVLFYVQVDSDKRFRFLFANQAFYRTTSLSPDKVIGHYVDEVIPEPSLTLVLGKYRQAIRERHAIKWEEVTEYPSGLKHGEVMVTPLFDDEGFCTGLVGSVHDITERKEFEQRIVAQAAILDHAHDAILIRNLDSTVRYWNQGAAKLYGWSSEEALGQKVTKILYADTSLYYEAQNKVIQDGEWAGEIAQLTKDGREITIEGSWTLLKDSQSQPYAILAINTDITEKKKLREQISIAQRMESLGTFAGGIAHDFNNLLTAIIGNINLAQRYLPPGEKAHEKLVIANSACTRATELVRRILTFSSKPEQRRTELHLQKLVQETTELLRSISPAMISITSSWQSEIPMISADASQIHQVMMNLATNSIQAMGDHGALKISLDSRILKTHFMTSIGPLEPGNYVVLSLEDTGPGMSRETLSRIFEPFFTTKAPGQGTGLGLSVVHGIIKDHGGGLTVSSELGKGAKFEMYFPALIQTSESKNLSERPPVRRGRGQCILFVDDEATILALGKHILESYGYRVSIFSDPREALHSFEANPTAFAAVMTDFAMPHLSGLELAQSILRIRPTTPIILTSGFIRPADEKRALAMGIREILMKPASVKDMVRALSDLFSFTK